MISNGMYDRLRKLKEMKNGSFSDVIMDLTENKAPRTLGNLIKNNLGILEEDKEYNKVMKEVRKGWDRWNKRYA